MPEEGDRWRRSGLEDQMREIKGQQIPPNRTPISLAQNPNESRAASRDARITNPQVYSSTIREETPGPGGPAMDTDLLLPTTAPQPLHPLPEHAPVSSPCPSPASSYMDRLIFRPHHPPPPPAPPPPPPPPPPTPPPPPHHYHRDFDPNQRHGSRKNGCRRRMAGEEDRRRRPTRTDRGEHASSKPVLVCKSELGVGQGATGWQFHEGRFCKVSVFNESFS